MKSKKRSGRAKVACASKKIKNFIHMKRNEIFTEFDLEELWERFRKKKK